MMRAILQSAGEARGTRPRAARDGYCAAMVEENVKTFRGVRTVLHPPSERAGRRRTVEERLRVLLPGASRLLADLILRLPPRSRLRQLLLARTMVSAYAAANRRDFELILAGNDPSPTSTGPAPISCLPTSRPSIAAMRATAASGGVGWMRSRTSASTPRRSSTSGTGRSSRCARAATDRAAAWRSASRSISCSPSGGAW